MSANERLPTRGAPNEYIEMLAVGPSLILKSRASSCASAPPNECPVMSSCTPSSPPATRRSSYALRAPSTSSHTPSKACQKPECTRMPDSRQRNAAAPRSKALAGWKTEPTTPERISSAVALCRGRKRSMGTLACWMLMSVSALLTLLLPRKATTTLRGLPSAAWVMMRARMSHSALLMTRTTLRPSLASACASTSPQLADPLECPEGS
mmetsp:Transcript_19786/g.49515  ORF Transcript_19786/g.49515 Transcript_19786/m.49515 type:complete len:209 (-) Transcript_19786:494-1120(-)